LNIIQDFIQINPFSRDGSKLKSKKGIVLHYTASPGAPAKNISQYFNGLKDQNPNDNITDRYAGAHFSVDRTSMVQSIPTDERGYHCGSPQAYMPEAIRMLGSYPNDNTVGIEMCIEADGSIQEETFQNTADLVVWLIQNDDFPNVLFTHKGVVGWKGTSQASQYMSHSFGTTLTISQSLYAL
jgi:N-acetylmuramoyl-L-alanine amidase